MRLYTYQAELVKVVRADTIDLKIDLGFKLFFTVRFSLARIDAEDDRGIAYVTDLLTNALEPLFVQSIKPDPYGYACWVGELYIGDFLDDGKTWDGINVNDELVKAGYCNYRH